MFFSSTFWPRAVSPTAAAEGHVVLGDLVALGEVRVVVVLAVELGLFGDATVEGEAGHDSELDRLLVDYWQYARHAQAHRTDVGVGGRVQGRDGARAEHLALRQGLGMGFRARGGAV